MAIFDNIRLGLRRGQRTLLMASLFLKLSKRTEAKGAAALAICNAELKLVEDISALEFPEMIKNRLWSDKLMSDVEHYLERGDIEGACKELWEVTPRMIRYGEEAVDDLKLTLRHVLRVRYNSISA